MFTVNLLLPRITASSNNAHSSELSNAL